MWDKKEKKGDNGIQKRNEMVGDDVTGVMMILFGFASLVVDSNFFLFILL